MALVVAAVAPFVATLFYGYVYDDSVIILQNPALAGWQSIVEVWKHPYWPANLTGSTGLYRPLLMECFAILLNGAHKYAIAFHAFAIALHVTATLLVAKLLRRAVGRWPATAAALWFALHPVHVEAVANISNTSEVLVCVWTILLALWLLPARDKVSAPSIAPGWGQAAVAALLYAAALFTKESGGIAPALALLVAVAWRAPPGPSPREAIAQARGWIRVIPLFVVVVIGVVIVRRLVLGGLTGTSSLAVPGLAELSAPQRVWAMLSTGGHVARLLLWPTMQTPDYGPTTLPTGIDRSLAASATVAVIVLGVAWAMRLALRPDRPDSRPLVGVLWCLIAYFPASNLIGATGPILAERTLYMTSAGVAMLVGWSLEHLFEQRAARSASLSRISLPTVAAAAVIVAACVRGYTQTKEYARVWRDHHALFTRIVAVDSLNYRGYQMLAIEAKDRRQYDESARLYARAYVLLPSEPTLLTNYGEYLLEMRRPRYALAIGERLMTHPDAWTDARAVTLLLNATARVWGVDSVLASAERLNARAPSARSALFIGMAYDLMGDSSAARTAYHDGLRIAPADSALLAHTSLRARPP
ncbi:MAG: hypothetical protein ABI442_01725 [Gemmatimonadaceae bacterium]